MPSNSKQMVSKLWTMKLIADTFEHRECGDKGGNTFVLWEWHYSKNDNPVRICAKNPYDTTKLYSSAFI